MPKVFNVANVNKSRTQRGMKICKYSTYEEDQITDTHHWWAWHHQKCEFLIRSMIFQHGSSVMLSSWFDEITGLQLAFSMQKLGDVQLHSNGCKIFKNVKPLVCHHSHHTLISLKDHFDVWVLYLKYFLDRVWRQMLLHQMEIFQ